MVAAHSFCGLLLISTNSLLLAIANFPLILQTIFSNRLTFVAKFLQKRSLLSLCLPLIISGTSLPVLAQVTPTKNPLDNLSARERASLRQGKPVVSGENGDYTARILLNATPSQAWAVITDYNNYSHFMPNVTASAVIESNGNNYIFEEVNRFHVAPLINVTERTRLAITEIPQSSLQFQMVKGKLKQLQGSWSIQPIANYPGTTQVLLTHKMQAQPKSKTSKSVFYSLFRRHVEATVEAVGKEVSRRSS